MHPEALRIFDINLRQDFYNREIIESSLRRANIFKLSDEELPVLDTEGRRKLIICLVTKAPFNRDSGTLRGKRCIRAGRAVARKALYMCALVGSRANPILKDFYQRLISKGKPPKVALTALMRKLVVHLNSSLKILNSQPA